jgi:hypothetical protein
MFPVMSQHYCTVIVPTFRFTYIGPLIYISLVQSLTVVRIHLYHTNTGV